MEIFILILKLLCGLALVLVGSEILVNGSSAIARRLGVSEFIIGLTIVGIGTSMPEMVVSCLASFGGRGDMSVGNVVGSNIFNTALILGLTAIIAPMAVTKTNLRRDLPINIISALMLMFVGLSSTLFSCGTDGIGRAWGAIFLLIFIAYLFISVKGDSPDEDDSPSDIQHGIVITLLMIAAGFAGLIWGGNLFVDSATSIAQAAGVSDKFIAITLLAGGTSLPELATCIVAACKGRSRMALGNIIGSNIANIFLILGSASLIHPITLEGVNIIDFGAMLACCLVVMGFAIIGKKRTIGRWCGATLLLLEAAYMTHLFMQQ